MRAGAHEDINVITLLLGAEEAGLEVKDRDGAWIAINPPPGALVCNIGDMLQRLTNHVLPSTTHRVVNPAPERRGFARYSTPFFLHFEPDFLIETLPACVSADAAGPLSRADHRRRLPAGTAARDPPEVAALRLPSAGEGRRRPARRHRGAKPVAATPAAFYMGPRSSVRR